MPNRRDIHLLADYNAWFNGELYTACATLPAAELAAPRGAYFGSILGTLNHIAVADVMWLHRFATLPGTHRALDPVLGIPLPTSLDQTLHTGLPALRELRQTLDHAILAWAGELSDADLDHMLDYRNVKGQPFRRHLGSLLLHFFNHQTHHRGQVTTLLTQAGVDVGATDLATRIPDVL